MNHSADTPALVRRFFELPHDLYMKIWVLILNTPRVINLEFQCGSDRRCSWQFNRDHIERLTYPARLLDSRNSMSFQTIGDFNRALRVTVNLGRSVVFKLSLERDIFYLQSFHSSMMVSAPSPVDTQDASLSEIKYLRRVMVSSVEILGILSSYGNPEWSWYEERFFGPIGHADSWVEEYIILLDQSPRTNYINSEDLIVLSEYEMLTAVSSFSNAELALGVAAGSGLHICVQTISAAWKAWSKAGSVRLPELSFARIRN